jgi:hypothetical protein
VPSQPPGLKVQAVSLVLSTLPSIFSWANAAPDKPQSAPASAALKNNLLRIFGLLSLR